MKPPFPGMNPYLEAPRLWPGFHNSFITYFREQLKPLLPKGYYADVGTREELGITGLEEIERRIVPDVAVKQRPRGSHGASRPHASAVMDIPEHIVIPDEEAEVGYLEIRDVEGHRVVTVIELLSPSNKLPGPDRDAFEEKQCQVLASDVNWIEIDLLRGGKRLGCHQRVRTHCQKRGYHYAVVVSRAGKRRPLDFEVYGFTVRDPFPVIGIPLREPDPDVALDLTKVYQRTFESGPYEQILSYDAPPDPPLE